MGWVILLCFVVIYDWMIKEKAEGSDFMDMVILRKDSVTPWLGDQKWDMSLCSHLCATEGKIPVPCDVLRSTTVATGNKDMAAVRRKPDDFVDKRD